MKKQTVLLFILLLSLLFSSCVAANGENAEENGKITVVATIFPYYDFARAVAGDRANVEMLIKPGSESHSYEPTPSEIIMIEKAEVFIYTGGQDDQWAQMIIDSSKSSKTNVLPMLSRAGELIYDVGEGGLYDFGSGTKPDHEHEYGGEHRDEHIWTSPKIAVKLVKATEQALCEADEENASYYRENAKKYIDEIEKLDREFERIKEISQDKLLVFADRFPMAYFARDYGFSCLSAFPGCSTQSEASAGTVASLINVVKEKNISYIYVIELSGRQIAEVISDETGADIVELQSCHNVSLSDFNKGETYISLMGANVDKIRKGFE